MSAIACPLPWRELRAMYAVLHCRDIDVALLADDFELALDETRVILARTARTMGYSIAFVDKSRAHVQAPTTVLH